MKHLHIALGKLLLGLTLGLSVAALTAFNVLLAWVATGPRSLDMLSPYIEIMFEPPDHKYSVSVGETWLVWDGWKHPIDIRLRNVKILTGERHTYSKFTEISLGLDLLGLLSGHLWPTSLTINHPVISLYANEDRSISFGLELERGDSDTPVEEPAAVPFSALLSSFTDPSSGSPLSALHLISIVNADMTITSKARGLMFKASGADLTFKRTREGLHAYAGAKIAYGNYESMISAEFTRKKNSQLLTGEVNASELMPGTLSGIFADESIASALNVPVSGKAELVVDATGALEKAIFTADGGKGTIDSPRLDGSVPVNMLHIQGQVNHDNVTNTNHLDLTQFKCDFNGTLIDAAGTAALQDGDPEIHMQVAAQNLAAPDIHLFWPKGVAPKTREWITSNITDGKITKATAKIEINHGDTAKPNLPQEDIDAFVELDGAQVRYLPEHPPVTDLMGKVHIDGKALSAQIDSASFLKNTKLTEGKVEIEDLNPDNPYIKVTFNADSDAKDVIHILELPPLKKAQLLNLHPEQAEGKVKAHAMLGFRFFAPRDKNGNPIDGENDVDFDVKANVTNFSQPGFMHKFDGKNVSGSFAADNKGLEFKGGGNINGADVSDADVKYLFHPEGGFDTFIEASATAPVESLPRFGYPAFDFLKGYFGIRATVKEGKNVESTQATIDLTGAAINMSKIYIRKPMTMPASLSITGEKKDDVASIPAFHFKARDMDAQGSAELNKDLSGIRRINMDKLILNGTDLDEFNYEKTDTGYIIAMRGNTLDVSPWMGKANKDETNFSFENFPSLQLKTDISHVVFDEGRELRSVKSTAECDARHCEKANINGATVDNKPFNFLILRNPKGRRQLSLHVQSAGAFLRAVNAFDGMEGGDLTVTGNYTEATATQSGHSILRGKADINEHTIKNASVLAKILSSASLTGLFDTLGGKGIRFTKLTAPFTLSNDVLTLDTAKTHGDAIGMTAEGTATFPKVALDIQGTIVPSYSLNHALGNVPLLGRVLTGGEGQGVFAARYSVKGTQKDPDVSVNPLSILTPGFLRGLFDIFDGPSKKDDEEDDESK